MCYSLRHIAALWQLVVRAMGSRKTYRDIKRNEGNARNMVMLGEQRNYDRTGHGVKFSGTKETSSVIPFNFTARKLSARVDNNAFASYSPRFRISPCGKSPWYQPRFHGTDKIRGSRTPSLTFKSDTPSIKLPRSRVPAMIFSRRIV